MLNHMSVHVLRVLWRLLFGNSMLESNWNATIFNCSTNYMYMRVLKAHCNIIHCSSWAYCILSAIVSNWTSHHYDIDARSNMIRLLKECNKVVSVLLEKCAPSLTLKLSDSTGSSSSSISISYSMYDYVNFLRLL